MNIVTRRIFNRNYEHTKTLILRLCKQSHCTHCSDNTRKRQTLITFQRFPEKYKYFLQYRKCTNVAVKNDEQKNVRYKNSKKETSVMHSMLQMSVYYANTIMPPVKTQINITPKEIQMLQNVHWSSMAPSSILNALKQLMYGHLCNVEFTNELFDDILEACRIKLSEFTDKEIEKLMQYLIVLCSFLRRSNICYQFMKELNSQCLTRFYSSDFTKLLFICDAFSQLKEKNSEYAWRALRKIGTKCYKLSAKEMVHFLFLLSLYKVPDLNMFEIQCSLEECLPELTADELGIAARGFFMSESSLSNRPLMMNIIKKVKRDVSSMNPFTIAAIMKLLRYSDCYHCLADLSNLLAAIRPEISRLPIQTLTHVLHASVGQRIYDKNLIDLIFLKIIKEISSARIKDIEKMVYTLCTIVPYEEYHQECNILLTELIKTYKTTRLQEIMIFRKSLLRIMAFLTYKNIYSQELTEFIMNPEYVTESYKYNLKHLTNEYLVLTCSLKIDYPEYKGPFVDHKIYTSLIQKHSRKCDVTEKHKGVQLRTEITYICKEKLGLQVYSDIILPHYVKPDTILGLDEYNNSISVEPILSTMPYGTIKRVDTYHLSNIRWIALLIMSNKEKVNGHEGYIAHAYAKYRQLKAIGYRPIPIPEHSFQYLSQEEKCNYLKQQIFQ